MEEKPTPIFILDKITFTIDQDINVSSLRITGWYYDSSLITEPEIRVFADDIEIGMLCFYVERPDVEAVYGKLAFYTGFDEKFIVTPNVQYLQFVDAQSSIVLLTQKLPGIASGQSDPDMNSLEAVYRKLHLKMTVKELYGIRNKVTYFNRMIYFLARRTVDKILKKKSNRNVFSPKPVPGFSGHSKSPFKVLFFSHNLNFEGAPKVIYNIAVGLMKKPGYEVTMVSPYDGPASVFLNSNGIKTVALTDRSAHPPDFLDCKHEGLLFQQQKINQIIVDEKPDLVFVNVLINYYIVNLACLLKIPVVWMIHESYTMENQQKLIPHFEAENYINAFTRATTVVFCTSFYRKYYKKFNFRKNFRVIHNALEPLYTLLENDDQRRIKSRNSLNIQADEIMILNVGIIVQHKNQELLVKAAELLKHKKVRFFLVGEREMIPYSRKIRKLVKNKKLDEKVTVVTETCNTDSYYSAADIFVYTSTNDTYPLVILEAMAFGLPIVTTPINGVNEQVRFGVNALEADYTDPRLLASQLLKMLENKALMREMGKNSRSVFENLETYNDMLDAHEKVILRSRKSFT